MSQNTIIILVIILIIVGVGAWYFTTQSNSASQNTPTTTATTTSTATAGGTKTSTHTTTSVSTNTGASSQGSDIVPPQIIEFDPSAGSVGTQVTITGTNFSHTTNYVMFGSWGGRYRADGTPDNQIAAVASADGTTLTFTIPTSGPSGNLCNAQGQCIEVSATTFAPGTYPVTVRTAGGTSNVKEFVLTK